MVEESSRRSGNKCVLERLSISYGALSNHWNPIHVRSSLLLNSMPMDTDILVQYTILYFDNYDVIHASLYWRSWCQSIDGNCWSTIFLYCWFHFEGVVTSFWLHVELTRSVARYFVCKVIMFYD